MATALGVGWESDRVSFLSITSNGALQVQCSGEHAAADDWDFYPNDNALMIRYVQMDALVVVERVCKG